MVPLEVKVNKCPITDVGYVFFELMAKVNTKHYRPISLLMVYSSHLTTQKKADGKTTLLKTPHKLVKGKGAIRSILTRKCLFWWLTQSEMSRELFQKRKLLLGLHTAGNPMSDICQINFIS